MEHFAWRLCKGILPTKADLSHREVQLDDFYCFCKRKAESTVHLFWECLWTKGIWFLSPLGLHLHFESDQPIDAWLFDDIAKTEAEGIQIAIMVLWSIWNAQNKMVIEGSESDPCAAITRA